MDMKKFEWCEDVFYDLKSTFIVKYVLNQWPGLEIFDPGCQRSGFQPGFFGVNSDQPLASDLNNISVFSDNESLSSQFPGLSKSESTFYDFVKKAEHKLVKVPRYFDSLLTIQFLINKYYFHYYLNRKSVDKVYSYILAMRFYVTPSSAELKVPIKLNTVNFFWNTLNRYHTKFAERKRDLLRTILQYKFTFMHFLISGGQVERTSRAFPKNGLFPVTFILDDLEGLESSSFW